MKNVCICCDGIIGASWAIGFANAGFKCLVYDSNQESIKKFEKTSDQLLLDLKILEPKIDVNQIKSNIILNCTINEICKDVLLIQESIIEDLNAKQQIFKELDRLSPKNTILASSSSYLLISKISEYVEHKNRCINAHPALPPHVVPFAVSYTHLTLPTKA